MGKQESLGSSAVIAVMVFRPVPVATSPSSRYNQCILGPNMADSHDLPGRTTVIGNAALKNNLNHGVRPCSQPPLFSP